MKYIYIITLHLYCNNLCNVYTPVNESTDTRSLKETFRLLKAVVTTAIRLRFDCSSTPIALRIFYYDSRYCTIDK